MKDRTLAFYLCSLAVVGIVLLMVLGCDDSKDPPHRSSEEEAAAINDIRPILPPGRMGTEVVQPKSDQYVPPQGSNIIASLQPSEGGWVHPWTMWMTKNGNFYINQTHDVHWTKDDKDWIWIKRRSDGWEVWLDNSKFQWTPFDLDYKGPMIDTVVSVRE